MQIQTEQDMNKFCARANKLGTFTLGLIRDNDPDILRTMVQGNQELISQRIIDLGSHLQQGIEGIIFGEEGEPILVSETPYIYPSKKLLETHPELTGPMTGNLSNGYDPFSRRFLFQTRGTDIAQPFSFQAAAAGMGRFKEHPDITAYKEVQEEAGIEHPGRIFEGYAHRVSPFMKAGQIPQPLFSYGFEADLSQFPVCNSLEDIEDFEALTKGALADRALEPREAYHFTVPYEQVERVANELHDAGKFYGPIYFRFYNEFCENFKR